MNNLLAATLDENLQGIITKLQSLMRQPRRNIPLSLIGLRQPQRERAVEREVRLQAVRQRVTLCRQDSIVRSIIL